MVWVVQHVQKPTLLYGGYNALEGNTPLLNELPVLLNAPVKDDLHTTIVALCVQFGNTYFTVFHLLPGASGFLLGGRNDGWGAVVPAELVLVETGSGYPEGGMGRGLPRAPGMDSCFRRNGCVGAPA